MNEAFENLINTVAAIVTNGEKDISPSGDGLKEMLMQAKKQGLFEAVCCMLSDAPEYAPYKRAAFASIVRSIGSNEYWRTHLEKCEVGGDVCHIKGITLARLYPVPEARVSKDTDILINEEDAARIGKYFESLGCNVEKRKKSMHHFEIHNQSGAMLEVHTSLCRSFLNTALFKNKLVYNEPPMEIIVDGNVYKTLGINDGLNFLTAHLVKHFVQEGITLRQALDLMLYIDCYAKNADMKGYFALWDEIGFLPFIKALLGIGNRYFAFNFEDCAFNELSEKILTEMQDNTMLEMSGQERKLFTDAYLRRHSVIDDESYGMLKKENSFSIKERLMPDVIKLRKAGYTYLKEHPRLIWAAWMHRLFKIAVKRVKRKGEESAPAELPAAVKNRLKLFEELKIS